MFCGKCGTQIPDGAAFCPSCGNPSGTQNQANPQPTANAQPTAYAQPAAATQKKISTNTIIGIAAVAAVVIAVAVILICVFAGGGGSGANSPEAVVEKYVKATIIDMDADAFLDCIHPDILKVAAEDEFDGDVDALKEQLQDMLDRLKEMMENFGDSVKISYEILESEDIEDEDLDEIKDYFKDEYGVKVTAAANVTFEQRTKGEVMGQEVDQTQENSVTVVKIDGKWYIDPESADIG